MLSGEVAAVEAVLDAYAMPRARDTKTGDLVHPARIVVLDGHGNLAYTFDNPPVGWLVEAVERLTIAKGAV